MPGTFTYLCSLSRTVSHTVHGCNGLSMTQSFTFPGAEEGKGECWHGC